MAKAMADEEDRSGTAAAVRTPDEFMKVADLAEATLYLTWQQDPTTTITIQWLSLPSQDETALYLKKEDGSWLLIAHTLIPTPKEDPYRLHRAEIKELTPDCLYMFRLGTSGASFAFRTLPDRLKEPLRFISGGDLYGDKINLVIETAKEAAKQSPSFALLGGDIAYSLRHSYQTKEHVERWVDLIKAWHSTMITPEGRMIPVLAAVGNHDVVGHFGQTPDQAEWFLLLFPHLQKKTYRLVDIGNYLSIWILDSGHAHCVDGHQAAWLKSTLLSASQQQHRIAIYHVPAYPAIRNYYNPYSSAIRSSWVPLFDAGEMHTAFEHHDHAYKRSYPSRQNRPHPKGTLYIGDGAWGVPCRKLSRKKPRYAEKVISKRHFILGTLHPNGEQHFKAIDSNGQVFDSYIHRRF